MQLHDMTSQHLIIVDAQFLASFFHVNVGRQVGLRNHYLCTYHAARLLMVPSRSGLIVNLSSYGGLRYL